jgi:effector-binding domain-containing protein
MSFIGSNKLKVSGAPFSITVKWDSVTMSSIMDIGIAVENAVNGKGRIQVQNFPEQKVMMAHYFGPYEKIAPAYQILEQYIEENDKVIVGAPWEIYITDPMTEKDTMKWETSILFPVK